MALMIVLVMVAGLVSVVVMVAEARGRSGFAWGVLSLAAGVVGFLAGVGLAARMIDGTSSDHLLMLSLVTPGFLAAGATVSLAYVAHRMPLKTSSRLVWPVHDLTAGSGHGSGAVALVPGAVRVELAGDVRVVPIAALRLVAADGECVRIGWELDGAAAELTLLPCGTPDTPAGRKQQSRVIERRVQQHVRAGSVGRLPAARVRR